MGPSTPGRAPSSPWVDPTHHLGDSHQSRGQGFLLPWWSSWGAEQVPQNRGAAPEHLAWGRIKSPSLTLLQMEEIQGSLTPRDSGAGRRGITTGGRKGLRASDVNVALRWP